MKSLLLVVSTQCPESIWGKPTATYLYFSISQTIVELFLFLLCYVHKLLAAGFRSALRFRWMDPREEPGTKQIRYKGMTAVSKFSLHKSNAPLSSMKIQFNREYSNLTQCKFLCKKFQ